ncbi:FkbM family methyltransferase [Blastomonas sp. SL216]|uniref:FkbM family methyltransferase n=1 Tax=Blastomonas sp. SL216 TaxID=2995169 RepID=UPI0023771A09|nr:FkbM family methyltransferase [Blastomonas sp. SL216]
MVLKLLKSFGVEVTRYSLFKRSIDLLVALEAERGRKPFFLQVGANNGIDFDDFFAIVGAHELPGIAVEPIAYYFQTLEEVYKRHRDIRTLNVAIHPVETSAILYRVDPAKVSISWQHGIGSFSRAHILKNGVPAEHIIEEQVECLSLADIVAHHVPENASIDILMCDTEGFDGEIMQMVDLVHIRPKVIKFESINLSQDVVRTIAARLCQAGYVVEQGIQDCVAVERTYADRLSHFLKAS